MNEPSQKAKRIEELESALKRILDARYTANDRDMNEALNHGAEVLQKGGVHV